MSHSLLPDSASDTRLSRRDLFLWVGGLVVASSPLALVGCGGGSAYTPGSSSGLSGLTGGVAVQGKVSVPSGLNAAQLQVVSANGTSPLSSSGFATFVPSQDVSLVGVLESASQRLVLLSMADPTATTNTLDATSTASALLYFSLGGSSMSPDGRRVLLSAISQSPVTVSLAATIISRLAADPFALANGDSTIVSALQTAAQSFAPQFSAGLATAVHPAIDPLLLLDNSNEVDGFTFVQTSSPLGFQVQNARRRPGAVYTYLTGHVDSAGNLSQVTPPQRIGAVLDVPNTSSLLNLRSGWHPVTSSMVPLTIQGQDVKTIYDLVRVSPVFGVADPALFSNTAYAGELATWKQEISDLNKAMFVGMVAGFVFEALGFGGLTWTNTELISVANGLLTVSTDVEALLVSAQQGFALLPAVKGLLTFIKDPRNLVTPKIIQKLSPLLAKANAQYAAEMAAGRIAAGPFLMLSAAIEIFLTVGAVGLALDLGAVYKDLTSGDKASKVTATVFQPTVTLSPSKGLYSAGNPLQLTAVLAASTGLSLSYHWSVAGSSDLTMQDASGTHTGFSFDSNDKVVVVDTTPSTQGTVTVNVEVFATINGAKVSQGTASSTFTKDPSQKLTLKYGDIDTSQVNLVGNLVPSGTSFAYVEIPTNSTVLNMSYYDTAGVLEYVINTRAFIKGNTQDLFTSAGYTASLVHLLTSEYSYTGPNADPHFPQVHDLGDSLAVVVMTSDWSAAAFPPQTIADGQVNVRAAAPKTKLTMTWVPVDGSANIDYST